MFYCVSILPYPDLQILVYRISAQDDNIAFWFEHKLPTKWYLATLVPRRMHQNFFEGLTKQSISNISFTKLLSLIADTMIWYLNTMSDLKLSCAFDFQSQSFIATMCIS